MTDKKMRQFIGKICLYFHIDECIEVLPVVLVIKGKKEKILYP